MCHPSRVMWPCCNRSCLRERAEQAYTISPEEIPLPPPDHLERRENEIRDVFVKWSELQPRDRLKPSETKRHIHHLHPHPQKKKKKNTHWRRPYNKIEIVRDEVANKLTDIFRFHRARDFHRPLGEACSVMARWARTQAT